MSTSKIKELSKEIANLISAGEVVERPASVVKELVENSLDAKATNIKIELINSGLKKITVLDNGQGMTKEEIPMSVKKHATSKINNAEDLFNITTLGFRGEALPSIISISKTTIASSIDGIGGYSFDYYGSMLSNEKQVSMNKGTKVEVNDLFFNTPARLKHLGTEQVELSHITTLINRFALANPYCSFTLINNSKIIYQTDGSGDIIALIAKTYGNMTAENLIYFENNNDLYTIKGYTTNNNVYRSNKNYINVIINHRIIRNLNMIYAICDAYKSIIPIGKYPICVLEINCNYDLIDVNVHPSKLEIRFTNEQALRDLITRTILLSIKNTELIYNASANDLKEHQIKNEEMLIAEAPNAIYEEKEQKKAEDESIVNTINSSLDTLWDMFETDDENNEQLEDANTDDNLNDENNSQPVMKKDNQITLNIQNNRFSSFRYIGQFNQTYLLFEDDNNLYLIDQHAAMERIMYEKIKKSFAENSIKLNELLIPLKIDISVAEITLLIAKTEELAKIGIIFEQFGGTTILVRQIPTWIPQNLTYEFVLDIINYLIHNQNGSKAIMYESLAKKLACKKSIKAHTNILFEEVTTLLENLDKCEIPYTCPHGRPTLVKITNYEIEKMFKRVV